MPQIYRDDDKPTIVRKIAAIIEHHNPNRYRIVSMESTEPAKEQADLILYEADTEKPSLLISVETVKSLGGSETPDHWGTLMKQGSLQIYVPKGQAPRAKGLLKRNNIKAHIVEY